MIFWIHCIISLSCEHEKHSNSIKEKAKESMNAYNDFCNYIRYDEGLFPKTARTVYDVVDHIRCPIYYGLSFAHEILKEHFEAYERLSNYVFSIYNENALKVIDFLEKNGVNTEFVGNVVDTLRVFSVGNSFGKGIKTINAETRLLKEVNKVKKEANIKIDSIKTDLINKNKCNKLGCKKIIEKYSQSASKEIDKKAYLEYQRAMKDLDKKYAKEYLRLQQTVKEANIINELIENRIKDKILDGYFDWKDAFQEMIIDDFTDKLIETNTLKEFYNETLTDMKRSFDFDFHNVTENLEKTLTSYFDPDSFNFTNVENFSFNNMCENLDNEEAAGPFSCLINEIGIPNFIIPNNEKDYSISGLSSSDICKLFWTLRSIEVNYTFSINYMSVSRTLFAETRVRPKYRIFAAIELYETGYDIEFDTANMIRLDMDNIYYLGNDNYGVKLFISEIDSTDAIQFTKFPEYDMNNVCCYFDFMNKTQKMYLNFIPHVVEQASIDYFSIKLDFIE